MRISRVVVFVIAALSTVVTLSLAQKAVGTTTPPRDGVFIHLSHGLDDPHRLLMGLQMASVMAEDKKDVIVYCDIAAVHALTRTTSDVTLQPFPTLFELLERLSVLHVTVMACPTCMKVAGIQARDLRPGVIVASKDRFFAFTEGRIVTLDY